MKLALLYFLLHACLNGFTESPSVQTYSVAPPAAKSRGLSQNGKLIPGDPGGLVLDLNFSKHICYFPNLGQAETIAEALKLQLNNQHYVKQTSVRHRWVNVYSQFGTSLYLGKSYQHFIHNAGARVTGLSRTMRITAYANMHRCCMKAY